MAIRTPPAAGSVIVILENWMSELICAHLYRRVIRQLYNRSPRPNSISPSRHLAKRRKVDTTCSSQNVVGIPDSSLRNAGKVDTAGGDASANGHCGLHTTNVDLPPGFLSSKLE
jgi:hypothetical protein